jgi:replicative DNA helicase
MKMQEKSTGQSKRSTDLRDNLNWYDELFPLPLDEESLEGYAGKDKLVSFRQAAHHFRNRKSYKIGDFGIEGLDRLTDGIHEGELVVLSGLTKHGKTLLAQTASANLAKNQVPSTWFTFEVPPAQFLEPFTKIDSMLDHCYMPLEHKAYNLKWVFHRILEGWRKNGSRVVFIDHLHFIMDIARARNPSLEVGTIVRALKRLAVDRMLAIVLICHVSKGQKEVDEDSYEHLRDSSLIAQESDTVIFVRRRPEVGECAAKITVDLHRRTGVMKQSTWAVKVGSFLQHMVYVEEEKKTKRYGYDE